MDLADIIIAAGAQDTGCKLRLATIASTTPLTIYLGGATTAVSARRLTSYTAVVSDFVAVLDQGPDLVVLGKIGT